MSNTIEIRFKNRRQSIGFFKAVGCKNIAAALEERERARNYPLIARALRLAVVQQQYNVGNLTEKQAKALLAGPLKPDDEATIFDDSDQLVIKSPSVIESAQ